MLSLKYYAVDSKAEMPSLIDEERYLNKDYVCKEVVDGVYANNNAPVAHAMLLLNQTQTLSDAYHNTTAANT